MGEEETLRGARNRIINARALCPGAHFYCGLEGGCAIFEEVRVCLCSSMRMCMSLIMPMDSYPLTCTRNHTAVFTIVLLIIQLENVLLCMDCCIWQHRWSQ